MQTRSNNPQIKLGSQRGDTPLRESLLTEELLKLHQLFEIFLKIEKSIKTKNEKSN